MNLPLSTRAGTTRYEFTIAKLIGPVVASCCSELAATRAPTVSVVTGARAGSVEFRLLLDQLSGAGFSVIQLNCIPRERPHIEVWIRKCHATEESPSTTGGRPKFACFIPFYPIDSPPLASVFTGGAILMASIDELTELMEASTISV